MSVTRSEATPVAQDDPGARRRILHRHADGGGPSQGQSPGSGPDRGRVAGRDLGQRFALIGVWILMAALFAIVEPSSFLHWTVLQAIFNSQTYLVFLALSLLCTLAVSEFVDLSFASVFGLSATLLPVLVVDHGWNFWLAAVVALVAALLAGVVNGVLVVYFRVSTIVVTLGMSITLLGIALWMSHLSEVTGISVSDQGWVNHSLLGLPLEFYYGLAAALVFAYVLAVTPLGRHIRAVGSNHEVSRLAGVPVNRLRFGAFILAAALAGLGGILAVTQVGGFDPNSTQGYLTPAFAAVFLGTAILQPGRFNPLGTFLAIFFLETGILGLQLLGASGWVSDVFYGGVLIIAVLITTLIRRGSAR